MVAPTCSKCTRQKAKLMGGRQKAEENLRQFEADVAGLVSLAYQWAFGEFREQICVSSLNLKL